MKIETITKEEQDEMNALNGKRRARLTAAERNVRPAIKDSAPPKSAEAVLESNAIVVHAVRDVDGTDQINIDEAALNCIHALDEQFSPDSEATAYDTLFATLRLLRIVIRHQPHLEAEWEALRQKVNNGKR